MENLISILKKQSLSEKHLGPFRFMNTKQMADYDNDKQQIQKCIAEVEVKQEAGKLICNAPSALHAAIFLKEMQNASIFSQGDKMPNLVGPMLFRGVKDNTYNIESTLYRYLESKDKGKKLARTFAELMKEIGDNTIECNLPINTYLAVSQHYGFPTNLIDFTPDPEIAVFFASNGINKGKGIVYFVPVSQIIKDNFRIYLSPPLFNRIQVQRGVFLESEGAINKIKFHQITFPVPANFTLYRDGNLFGDADVRPEIVWINKAIKFIYDHQNLSDIELKEKLKDFWLIEINDFPIITKEFELSKWCDYYEDMCYWLAYVMNASGEYILPDLLGAIEKDNQDLYVLHKLLKDALKGK